MRAGRERDAMRREIETVTGREITIGSVYATLDRLEGRCGWRLLGHQRLAASFRDTLGQR